MNKDILEGKWKQIRGEVKAWWGRLLTTTLTGLVVSLTSSSAYCKKNMDIPASKPWMKSTGVTEYEANLKDSIRPTSQYK